MKLRLSILLFAAALAASPAVGQTIKSLGYNTTNGNIVAATNVTFTNSVGFATNARAATRTNLGGTTVGNSVFTATNAAAARSAIGAGTVNEGGEPSFESVTANLFTAESINEASGGLQALDLLNFSLTFGTNYVLEWSATDVQLNKPLTFFGTNTASTTRTNLGLGATNNVTFSNITANGIVNAQNATLGTATNAATAQGIQWSGLGGAQHAAIYGAYDGVAEIALSVGTTSNALSDVATFRATGMTVNSNAIVGGTLGVTGNATLSGVNNTATAQTASSGSSLMTRDLSDDRYRLFYVPLVHALSSTAANGSTWNLRPFHSADAVFSAPPWARNVRVYLSTAFTNAPITNNFTAVITVYQLTTNSIGSSWGVTTNAFSVTPVFNNGSNFHRFIFRMTNDMVLSANGISDAESAGFWNILIQLRNDSSGSLTTPPDNWLRGMAVFSD